MSWSVALIGRPEKIVEALEAESAKQSGQCKIEFDAAMPHLIGLVRENFDVKEDPAYPILLRLEANGSGQAAKTGEEVTQINRSCTMKLERIWGKYLI